jgi:hypothetical protein
MVSRGGRFSGSSEILYVFCCTLPSSPFDWEVIFFSLFIVFGEFPLTPSMLNTAHVP